MFEHRVLLPQLVGGETLALFDHFGRQDRRPHLHKEENVIRLDRQFEDPPALFGAYCRLVCDNRLRSPREHGFAPFGSPDQMMGDQVDVMLVALILQFHAVII